MPWSTTLRQRTLRRDDHLLERIQWLFTMFNCLLAVLIPLDLTHPDAPDGARALVVLVSGIALGVWSIVYYRAKTPGFVLDVLPLGLLLVQGMAAGPGWIFARMYVAVFLVGLYRPGRARLVILASAYLLVYETTVAASGDPLLIASIFSEGISVLVVMGIMQTLATAVRRHAVFAQRDTLLTEVVAGLLHERDAHRISAVVADAALRLVDVPGAIVTVWRSDGSTLHRTGLAGCESYPLEEADLTGIAPKFRAIYDSGRPAYLDAAQISELHEYYGINPDFAAVIVAPMLRDNEPSGLLVVGSPEPLDSDLLKVLERFAHEVTLAQQLAEREAMFIGLVENSSDIIALIDEDDRFTFVSAAVCATTGLQPSSLIGRHVGVLLHRTSSDAVSGVAELARSAPTALRMHAVGQALDVEVTANRLADGMTILNIRNVSDRRRLEAEIEHRAFHDDVTGLPNRTLLLDRLDHAIRRQERSGGVLAVAMMDLDEFKGVNDTLGHAAGDTLLQMVADRVSAAIRDTDTVARLGGDEFALVLEGFEDSATVNIVIDRILGAVREPMTVDGVQVSISASIGLTLAETNTVAAELLRNADAAMYAAKKLGKNRCATFNPSMHQQGINRLELRTDLQTALHEGQFVLHYQPIMALPSSEVVGFEALVRWNHPSRGLVAPLDFIPVAEETGLIVALGRWILHEGCQEVARWQADSPTPIDLSINLSAIQLRTRDVIEDVAAALAASGLEPSRLTLEVTETALMGDPEIVAEVLRGLKSLGVRLAIDDFGTGYSSFAHLQSLPIDVIKVDRSFVSVVGNGPEQAAYAKAIVSVAHTLGLETVAEGVEVEEHSRLLTSWGCGLAQGWLWYPSMPAAEAAALVMGRIAVGAGSVA